MKEKPASGEWRVTVDPDACIGSGMCLATAPDHFEFGPDRRSRPVTTVIDVDDAAATAITDAADCCPAAAITVIES
jgi:ferredoxin